MQIVQSRELMSKWRFYSRATAMGLDWGSSASMLLHFNVLESCPHPKVSEQALLSAVLQAQRMYRLCTLQGHLYCRQLGIQATVLFFSWVACDKVNCKAISSIHLDELNHNHV